MMEFARASTYRFVLASLLVLAFAMPLAHAKLRVHPRFDHSELFGEIEDDGYSYYTLSPAYIPAGFVEDNGSFLKLYSYQPDETFREQHRFSVSLLAHRYHDLDLMRRDAPEYVLFGTQCREEIDRALANVNGGRSLQEVWCDYEMSDDYGAWYSAAKIVYFHGLTSIEIAVSGYPLEESTGYMEKKFHEPTPERGELESVARQFLQAFMNNASAEGFDTVDGYGDGSDAQSPTDVGVSPPPIVPDIPSDTDYSDAPFPTPAGNPTTTEVAVTAAGAAAVGGIAGIGAWLMLGQTGVGRREALDALGELLRGRMPSDGFDDWKAKYEALGWTYREENGVAIFDPPPGHVEPPPLPVMPVHRDGEVNPDTGEVWSDEDGGWIGRNLYEQEKRRAGDIAAIQARSDEAMARYDAETQRLDALIAASARDRAAREAAAAAARQRISEKLTSMLEAEGRSTGEVERLRTAGDDLALEEMYVDAILRKMEETSADAAYWTRWSKIHGAGEFGSRIILAGAKTGMMAVTGPAGFIPAAVGSGVLRSVEEVADTYVKATDEDVRSGKLGRKIGTAFLSGLVSGVKDGVVGRFTSLPGTSAGLKIAVPMAADTVETGIRTGGDLKAMATTAIASGVGGKVGTRLDNVGNAVIREVAHVGTSTVIGTGAALVNGGKVDEAVFNSLADSIGGRAGTHLGSQQTPLTHEEILMNQEYDQKIDVAKTRIRAFKDAIKGGDQAKIKATLHEVLNNREAKILMKKNKFGDLEIDADFKTAFADLTQQHRTDPLLDETVKYLNEQTIRDTNGVEQPRFVMLNADGSESPVTRDAFELSSGKGDGGPGVDVDMSVRTRVIEGDVAGMPARNEVIIIDKAKGGPADRYPIEDAVKTGAKRAGIDPRAQEINLTGQGSKEDYPLEPGQSVPEFLQGIEDRGFIEPSQGAGISNVGRHKLLAAEDLHGGGARASVTSDRLRIAAKQYERFLDPGSRNTTGATVADELSYQHGATRESVYSIAKQGGELDIPTGTAVGRLRVLTANTTDVGNIPEMVVETPEKLSMGEYSKEAVPASGPIFTGGTSRQDLQQQAADAARELADKEKDQ